MLSAETGEELFYSADMHMASKRDNRPTDRTGRKPAKPPARLTGAPGAGQNRELQRQTRKLLGRHYAAKYRVR